MTPIAAADSWWAVWIAACGMCVFVAALYSGAETGLYCLNRLRLSLRVGQAEPGAHRLQTLLRDQPGLLFVTLLGTNAAHYLAPVCLTILLLGIGLSETRVELIASLILTPTILVFADILPKVIFERHADRLMLRLSRFLEISYLAARHIGMLAVQNGLSRFVLRRFHAPGPAGGALQSRMELYHLLHESGVEGALSRTQLFMVDRVHMLAGIHVDTVMIPLNRVTMLQDTTSAADAAALVRNSPFSRFPVFRNDRSRPAGLVHALDVLLAQPHQPITWRLYPPIELPERTNIVDALSRLQIERRRMAFVVDSAGACRGIVTVKDLVEEIVGEFPEW